MQDNKIIIVKIGTHVLQKKNGGIDEIVIKNVIENIVEFMKKGYRFIIVSSGAVAQGRVSLKLKKKTKITKTQLEQIYASIGQVHLMNVYQKYFKKSNVTIAQALLTKRDFSLRDRYTSMKEVLLNLLYENVVPIINENDVISPEELDFSDNDQLSAYVAGMINADLLLILTNVDGFYTKHPDDGGTLISKICIIDSDIRSYVSDKKTQFGRGGMISKIETAKFLTELSIPMHLANGKHKNIIKDVLNGKNVGTQFCCRENKKFNELKRWLKMGAVPKGSIIITSFLANLLQHGRRTSILNAGILKIQKQFEKQDIIEVFNEDNESVGFGVAKISSKEIFFKEGIDNNHKAQVVIHTDYFMPSLSEE